MRIFKNAWFERFVRKQNLSGQALARAVERAEQGLIDADLGGGVIKQRVARPGQGKSGGFRTVVFYRAGQRVISRDVLLQEVWGYNSNVTTHTLETHIYRLRQKIEVDPGRAKILVTESGGYKLVP